MFACSEKKDYLCNHIIAVMNQATRDFIHDHAEADVRQLALQGTKDPEVDLPFALNQIAGRQTARTKLPSWAAIEGIVYPPHLSMEQCSSELTAIYKASIVGEGRQDSNHLFIDLTGGFGVDFAFMARHFERAVYVEQQPSLCAVSSENFKCLGLMAEVVNGDGIDYLHSLDHADLIFLDPARRDGHGGRTYGIADCTPNVLELIDELLTKADRVLLKLSPMLDWRKAVADIGCVSEVHIVSVNNECKELVIKVESEKRKVESVPPSLRVVCVNLLPDGTEEHFEFDALPSPHTSQFSPLSSQFSVLSSQFLFAPNASIMKAGCFDLLAECFGIQQLDKNSHLFVADHEVRDFPGRQFVIDQCVSMNKRELKQALAGLTHANIAVRNFPLSVAELRKRLKLKDGGDVFIFATTVAEKGHLLLICHKMK
jgi:hypothetical protein